MFCQCFCPGKRTKYKQDIEIEHNGKIYKLVDVAIEKCNNNFCEEGFMTSEMWEYIKEVVGKDFNDMGTFHLSRKVFAQFKE